MNSSFGIIRVVVILLACILCYSCSHGESIKNLKKRGNGHSDLWKFLNKRRNKKMKAKNDGDDNTRRNKALFEAAHNGDIDGAKYAIERGADINGKGRNGWTAMHKACSMGQLKMITFLLKNGANINLENKFGETPAIYCASYSIGVGVADVKCVKLMKKLHHECADIEKPSKKGWTPLDAAKQSYNKRCIKAITKLIKKGSPSSCVAN